MTTASRWAEQYRITKDGPWSFYRHPWSRAMHDSTAEFNIGQKSAQMAYSETLLNVTFFKMDVEGVDCLYILPNKHPDASEFSSGRFDAAIEYSTHLQNMFSSIKNVGHKKAGAVSLYIRGSRSKAGLKSLPVGAILFDEVNEMTQSNIPLAFHRTSGQMKQLIWMVSTPTIEGEGINFYFRQSTQDHFFFTCPHCSRQIELTFPESLVITADDSNDPNIKNSHLICTQCKHELDNLSKPEWLKNGVWVPQFSQFDKRGFYINQLYSCMHTRTPVVLAKEYLESRFNAGKEQEYYNSSMGLTHATAGSTITDEQINDCMKGYKNATDLTTPPNGLITMGIDVNYPQFNIAVCQWFTPKVFTSTDIGSQTLCKVIRIDVVKEYHELEELIAFYKPNYLVIDAQPERRPALALATKYYGRSAICFYAGHEAGKMMTFNKEELSLTVHRTTWLDAVMARFKNKTIELPVDTPQEFRSHIKAMTRVIELDRHGNSVARYGTEQDAADHYTHALTYAEIALTMAMGARTTVSIASPC